MSTSLTDAPAEPDSPASRRRPAPSRGLVVHVEAREPDLVTIRVAGKLDIYTIARLRERIARYDVTTGEVELDVSRVTLIDSSGLGTLLSIANRARRAGHRLRLLCTSDLADVLQIARLADAFDLTIVDADRGAVPAG